MQKEPAVQTLYDALGGELCLTWVAGRHSGSRKFFKDEDSPRSDIVGHFNLIHSSQAQILGATELDHLASLSKENHHQALKKLFGKETVVIIISNDLEPSQEMYALADEHDVGLFKSSLPGERLINDLRYYLTRLLAQKTTMHGVFMEVISVGVLLVGASSVGKSELALDLVTRGHRLIADDAPLFARIAPDIVVGTSHPILQDFLEVRGLGILNIRRMYGDSAIKTSKYLRLIIDLQPIDEETANTNRLMTPEKTRPVLGMEVPIVTLPVAPGRNLAVLVEAAVRNHLLRLSDYHADADITDRQKQLMNKS